MGEFCFLVATIPIASASAGTRSPACILWSRDDPSYLHRPLAAWGWRNMDCRNACDMRRGVSCSAYLADRLANLSATRAVVCRPMNPFTVLLLICQIGTPVDACQPETARAAIHGPRAANEIACGQLGIMSAGGLAEGVRPEPGKEYLKIQCARGPNAP
jgi:hypothetical protein